MGRPFSQQLVGASLEAPTFEPPAGAFVAEFCDIAPGLSAPAGAPVPDPPLGLNDGAFVAEIGD